MPKNDRPFKFTRRDVLKALAGSAGTATTLPILNNSAAQAATCAHAARQEAAKTAAPYAPKFFDGHQMQLLAELVEILIPTDEHSPGAKAARVHEYIDEIVADESAPQKRFWKEGIAALDQAAQQRHGLPFLQCRSDQQIALMVEISRQEENPRTPEERLFKMLKDETIRGYYTSEIGIHQDLQYVGNTYLDEFPGCTNPKIMHG